MRGLVIAAAVVCLIGCAESTSAQRTGDVPYDQATYEVSRDPLEVVLEVVTITPLIRKGHSLTVYGDGRVEMQFLANNQRVLEERATQLDEDELQALMDLAVHQGLVEWEPSTIDAWMRQSSPNLPVVADGVRVRVSIHLESYERGGYSMGSMSHTLNARSPHRFAEWYPEIKQFEGVLQLVQWLEARWKALQPKTSGETP